MAIVLYPIHTAVRYNARVCPKPSTVQESALLRLAERQAGREEELAEARKQAEEADARTEDLAQDISLLQQQVAALKEVSLHLLFALCGLRALCRLVQHCKRLVTEAG